MKSYGSPHLAAGTILLLTAALGLCGSERQADRAVPPLVISSLYGPDLFRFYCASCHGQDGKGNRTPPPGLTAAPPDLTTMAERSGGVFPSARVERILTGAEPVPSTAHGSTTMPVWGAIFRALDADDRRGQTRLANIVAQVRSLQENQQGESAWPTYPAADAPPLLQSAIQRGDLVIATLQGALLTRLRSDLDAGGPELAIQSCHLAAIATTNDLARDEGLAAGRTAARLRNPANAPRPWAAAIVRRYADQRSAAVPGFAVDLGDRVGVLRPIREQSICAPCHGPEQAFSTRVRAELAARYPRDRGTGFREGDIRGWFWVEIPKH